MSEDRLNVLERAIAAAEDGAEDGRWAQAAEVARRLDAGESTRGIAGSWTNARTGRPYSERHVRDVAAVWRRHGGKSTPHPRWVDAYNEVSANDSATRVERDQARPPLTVDAGSRLVDNLVQKAPAAVVDHVRRELVRHEAGVRATSPAERKARAARAREATGPLVESVNDLSVALSIVSLLDGATQALREVTGSGVLTGDQLGRIEGADEAWREELEVARAMVGLEARP